MPEIRIARTARKPHRCQVDTGTRCRTVIHPGERYIVAEVPPSAESSNGRWQRMKVCGTCATRYGQTIDEQVTPRRSTRPPRTRTTAAAHQPA